MRLGCFNWQINKTTEWAKNYVPVIQKLTKQDKKSVHIRLPPITEDKNGDGGNDDDIYPKNMNTNALDCISGDDVEEIEDSSNIDVTDKESYTLSPVDLHKN